MRSLPVRFILLLLALVSLSALAALPPQHEALAADPQWLRLLHYEADAGSPSGWRSAIHSPEFFLAPGGRDDPRAELAATLAAMAEPPGSDPDDHPRCRFPARQAWLRALPESPLAGSRMACPKFDGWTRAAGVESISIVLATGFLGNPASYYGHTLLKFNFAPNGGHSRLQDASVNYGAILTGSDDGAFVYMLKGVFGGYDGGFSDIQYYFHEHNYGENELRDLWEYRLDLPPEAVSLIVAHAWEVLGQRYTYYFFRRNCAFRMGEVLQVVDGLQLIPPDRPWTIPQALLQVLANGRFQGHPLVAEVIYQPSRQSRFYERYRSLAPDEAALLGQLVSARTSLADPAFGSRPLASRQAILDALLDYHQFVTDPADKAAGRQPAAYREILAARYRLPPGESSVRPPPPEPPHLGRPPSWLQVGWLHDGRPDEALSLRLRPAYYDALDTGSGHVRHAVLAMGDVQLTAREGALHLQRLELLAIESVNPGWSGLPGDRGAAWKLRAGAEPLRLSCTDCVVARVQGDIGLGRQLSEHLFAALYAGAAMQEHRPSDGLGFMRGSATLLFEPAPEWTGRLAYERRFPVDARRQPYGASLAEARRALGSRHDVRLRYDYDGGRMLSLGIGTYW